MIKRLKRKCNLPVMRNFILLLSIVTTCFSCVQESTEQEDSLVPVEVLVIPINGEYTIPFEETIEFPYSKIKQIRFSEVKEETRCPSDVECAWEGRAVVIIEFSYSDVIVVHELIKQEGNPELAIGTVQGFTVELEAVNPYPVSTDTLNFETYSVVLKIE